MAPKQNFIDPNAYNHLQTAVQRAHPNPPSTVRPPASVAARTRHATRGGQINATTHVTEPEHLEIQRFEDPNAPDPGEKGDMEYEVPGKKRKKKGTDIDGFLFIVGCFAHHKFFSGRLRKCGQSSSAYNPTPCLSNPGRAGSEYSNPVALRSSLYKPSLKSHCSPRSFLPVSLSIVGVLRSTELCKSDHPTNHHPGLRHRLHPALAVYHVFWDRWIYNEHERPFLHLARVVYSALLVTREAMPLPGKALKFQLEAYEEAGRLLKQGRPPTLPLKPDSRHLRLV